jgi:MYXO-CTERM domain-containing protein
MKTTLLLALTAAASLTTAQAASYLLGESDPGAANGVALNATTTGLGGPNLSLMSTGGTYSNNVPAGGSAISAAFNGGQIFGGAGGMLAAVPDVNNFSMGFDAFPTSSPSFHIALTLGSNFTGDGAGGNLFIYHTGGTWHVHSNGVGDFDTGLAANLNAWNKVTYNRVGGVGTLTVNGVTSGVASPFPGGGVFKDAMSIGGNRNNSGAGFEGGFIGNIDNVFVGTPVPEPSAALLGGLAGLALIRRRRD